MSSKKIEEWIDANKQLMFVDENHAEHMIPIDKFRKLLKDNAIVPRKPTMELYSELLSSWPFSFDQLQRFHKALLEGNEWGNQ